MQTLEERMIAEGRRIGWPIHYQSDIPTHDTPRIVRARPGDSFLWLVMYGGTFLAHLSSPIELAGAIYWLRQSRAYRIDIEDTIPGTEPRATGRLEPITAAQAFELIQDRLAELCPGMRKRTR